MSVVINYTDDVKVTKWAKFYDDTLNILFLLIYKTKLNSILTWEVKTINQLLFFPRMLKKAIKRPITDLNIVFLTSSIRTTYTQQTMFRWTVFKRAGLKTSWAELLRKSTRLRYGQPQLNNTPWSFWPLQLMR